MTAKLHQMWSHHFNHIEQPNPQENSLQLRQLCQLRLRLLTTLKRNNYSSYFIPYKIKLNWMRFLENRKNGFKNGIAKVNGKI